MGHNTYPGTRRGKLEKSTSFQGPVDGNGNKLWYKQKHFNIFFQLITSK